MSIKRRTEVKAEFSMSSLTDIIFLLLIFFMLTSTFVSTSGVKVNLPESKGPQIVHQTAIVTVTEDYKYYVNNVEVQKSALAQEIRNNMTGSYEDAIIIRIDESLDYEDFVEVLKICNNYTTKVVIATRPEK